MATLQTVEQGCEICILISESIATQCQENDWELGCLSRYSPSHVDHMGLVSFGLLLLPGNGSFLIFFFPQGKIPKEIAGVGKISQQKITIQSPRV